jgi:hypothetical protein
MIYRSRRARKPKVRGSARVSAGFYLAELLERRLLLTGTPVSSNSVASNVLAPTFIDLGPVSLPSASVNSSGENPDDLSAPFTPAEIREAYELGLITANGVTGDGAGETIALVDAYNDPNILADAAAFSSNFDLPAFNTPGGPSLTVLNEDGGTSLTGVPNSSPGGWDVEESLDVEWAHTVAPDANIILFEANSPENSDLFTAVETAADYAGVSAVSMSWGETEYSGETAYDSDLLTPTGHQGVTFITSAGDSGAIPQYPSVSPNVLSVGGTSLTINSNGSYGGETAWSDGGGGLSAYESQPSYQVGKLGTVITTQRATPDVSWLADPNTGVYVLDTWYTPGYLQVGGTSLAAPMWAGLISITNQIRASYGFSTLNGLTQTLPTLYDLSSKDFNDIMTGNNGYPAGPGYDLATGLGTPIGPLLAPDLALLGNAYLLVSASTPAAGGSVIGTAPTTFTIDLAQPVNTSTVSASELTVNGIAANSVSIDPTDEILTFTFNTTPVTTQGAQTMNIAEGVMKRASDGAPNAAFNGTFNYVTQQLAVVSASPVPGSTLSLAPASIQLTFNEAVNPSSVNTSNLTLNEGTVTGDTLSDGNTVITYSLNVPLAYGPLNVSLPAGAITDMYGVGQAAYSVSYDLVPGSLPLPTPLTALAPLGSQMYETSTTGAIGEPPDTDDYTITLNAGQVATVFVHPMSSTLKPVVTLLGPTSSVLGATTSAGAGEDAVIQTAPVTTQGTYTIVVTGAGSTVGSYSVELLLNATVEMAEHNGPPDTTMGTAQNLDSEFETISGSSEFISVAGALNVTTTDFYSVTLQAGQTLTAAQSTISGSGSVALNLFNSSGTEVATGASGASNVNLDIAGYVAPSPGLYYLEVGGSSGIGYTLVVAKNTAFSLEPHYSESTAQNISGIPETMGYIGAGTGGAVVTLDSTDTGWWDENGDNTPGNTNYLTGLYSADLYNSFYVFNLSGITQPIASAELGIYNPTSGYTSSNPSETLGFFDVSTPIASLEAGGAGQTSIYQDLGTGVSYGTTTVSAADDGETVTSSLDAAAISAMNADLANQFAIGGSLTSPTVGGYVFGFSGGTSATLQLNLGGGADWYGLNVTSLSQIISFTTATPSEGSGQFNNNLDPHVQVYDPNGNLVATGTKLADGRNELVVYQPLITGTYTIEVSAQNGTVGEYELNQGNALTLSLPANMTKGQGTLDGTITATTAPSSNLTVNLTSSDPTRLSVPATVTILAGQTTATVPLTSTDDHKLDGPELVTISGSATGYFGGSGIVDVHDNETATLSVTLPATATKGQGIISGVITSSAAPAENIVVALSSSNSSQLSVPATVTLLAGHTTVNFQANVLQDTVIDGTQYDTVTASVENWTSGTATVAIADDNNTISISLPPSDWEGQAIAGGGTVTLGGTSSVNEVINLVSSNPDKLVVPSTVTVLAGQTTANFNITLVNDGLHDGDVTASVTGSAAGLTNGTGSMIVRDANVSYLTMTAIASPQIVDEPFSVTVDAYNVDNEIIATDESTIALSATGTDGAVVLSPNTITFDNGTWIGNATIETVDPGVTLTANAGGGVKVSSSKFAVQPGPVSSFQFSTIASPQTPGSPFSVTITAEDANGFKANYNGTSALSLGTSLSGTTILLYQDSEDEYYEQALNALGLKYTVFTSDTTFESAVAGANPANTLAIADAEDFEITLSSAATFIAEGGRMIVNYWGMDTLPSVASAFDATVIAPFNTPTPVYNWGGSTFFNGVSSPLGLEETIYNINGDTFQPASGGTAVAGLTSSVTTDEGSIIIGNSGRTILNGFELDDAQTPSAMTQLVENEISSDLVPAGSPVSITPTSVTFTNGVWTGNVTVASPIKGAFLQVTDGSIISSSNSFDVSPYATAAPVLTAGSDTGISQTDGITDLNNSSPSAVLQFSVANTVIGATVDVYANGEQIGSALATGTTTIVTTNGVTPLADGSYSITATQAFLPDPASPASSGTSITINTAVPVPTITAVTPNPHLTSVSSMTITFSVPVYNLTLSGLDLSLNDGSDLLTSSQTLTTSNHLTWTLGNLSGITGANGAYTLSLAAGAAESVSGELSTSGSTSWVVPAPPEVSNITVDGTAWSSTFLSYLSSLNSANAGGYSIPVGSSAQLAPLPWKNLNQINITFTQNVTVTQSDLQLVGENVASYGFSNFSYNMTTDTATWTLSNSIGDDKLLLDLSGAIENGFGIGLDGAWTNGVSTYPSGNDTPGTAFIFDFDVLPGDVNQSGAVNILDAVVTLNSTGTSTTTAGYSIFADVTGSGAINILDAAAVLNLAGTGLPTETPVAPAIAEPVIVLSDSASNETTITDSVLKHSGRSGKDHH